MKPTNSRQAQSAVLVVEPDPVLRELIGIVVEDAGYIPLLAANLGEAVVKASTETPSVVLAEITDGPVAYLDQTCLAALRDAWPGIPTILCTSHPGAEALDPATSGFRAIIVKPFELDHLLGALSDAIALSDPASDLSA